MRWEMGDEVLRLSSPPSTAQMEPMVVGWLVHAARCESLRILASSFDTRPYSALLLYLYL